MRVVLAASVLALLSAGCQAHGPGRTPAGPLQDEGEVYLYLQPLPAGAERLSFTFGSAAAVRGDGPAVPLALAAAEVSGGEARGQRLVAWGRLAPGSYSGLQVAIRSAALASGGATSSLLVPPEPLRLGTAFTIVAGKATVLHAALRAGPAAREGFAFEPAFSVALARAAAPQLSGYCSGTGVHGITVFDKHTREVVGVLPTGRAPEGMALDPAGLRLYVALSGEDQVQVLDVSTGGELLRIPLRPGDEPRELGLTPDGRTLVVVNRGSATVSFIDPAAGVEVGRVATGDQPGPLLVDRSGRRAYVLNQGAASLTVLDLGSRIVAATVATDPQPVRAALSRAGDRLYVVHAASSSLLVLAIPGLSVVRRIAVGPAASGVKVDPRTDLVYVASRDRDRLQIFDPLSLLPVSQIEVPGPASQLAIDEAENVLFALVPERTAVAAVDLASGRLLGTIEVGEGPYQLILAGERR